MRPKKHTWVWFFVVTGLLFVSLLFHGETAAAGAQRDSIVEVLVPIHNPANGHYYSLVEVEGDGLKWYEASVAAAAMEYAGLPGHLATITSQQEQDFIEANFPQIFPFRVWLGANDEAFEGLWGWVTGEAWDYSAWEPGEPNGGTNENCLDYNDNIWGWNDSVCLADYSYYLVEFSTYAYNAANGHYYGLVKVQVGGLNWSDASAAAAAMSYAGVPGHLATITSQQEQDFIESNFPQIQPQHVWLGASDLASEGDWVWITGEDWDYTQWGPGEPNGGPGENCLDFDDGNWAWNDNICELELPYYLVEFSIYTAYLPLIFR